MRIAVIGMGSIGRRHAQNLVTLGHRPLVYDKDLNAGGTAFDEPTLWDTALSMKGLWDWKPDAVLICTPPDSHNELAYQAISRRIPFFIEKPLGTSMEDWAALGDTCDDAHLVNMVACNRRFGTSWIKDRMGTIGDVIGGHFWTRSYLPTWRPWQDYNQSYSALIGAILDCGSHEVDLATWLLGPAKLVASIKRSATSIGLDCDGSAELALAHECGAVSSVHLSFTQVNYSRGLKIYGTEGMLEGSESPGGDHNPEYVDELCHFLHCVETGEQTCNPISQAVKTLEILLEAKRCSA